MMVCIFIFRIVNLWGMHCFAQHYMIGQVAIGQVANEVILTENEALGETERSPV